MNITREIATLNARYETSTRAHEFTALARANLLGSRGVTEKNAAIAALPPKLQAIAKAAVAPGATAAGH